jgi:hypothetical protein
VVLKSFAFGLLAVCASCAATAHPTAQRVPSLPLVGVRGEPLDTRALVERASLTVIVFFSPDCRCLDVHEPRLHALFDAYHPRGVQFFMVDSEARGSLERDAAEAERRGYPFPILGDRGAKLADAVGAEYATYSVIVDASGRVRYRGGIDTDKLHVHDDAIAYLKDALDDLLADRPPRVAAGKALGCSLQKW